MAQIELLQTKGMTVGVEGLDILLWPIGASPWSVIGQTVRQYFLLHVIDHLLSFGRVEIMATFFDFVPRLLKGCMTTDSNMIRLINAVTFS